MFLVCSKCVFRVLSQEAISVLFVKALREKILTIGFRGVSSLVKDKGVFSFHKNKEKTLFYLKERNWK